MIVQPNLRQCGHSEIMEEALSDYTGCFFFFFCLQVQSSASYLFWGTFFIPFFAEAAKYKSKSWSIVLGAVMYILNWAGTCITFQWDKNHCCVLDKRAKFLSCFNGRWHLYCQMNCSTSFLKESPLSVAQNSFSSPSWFLLLPRMGESCAVLGGQQIYSTK